MNSAHSLHDLIRRRQRARFVGRQGELTRFAENLALPPEDLRRDFVFAVHGDAGVGKTFLTQRLRESAGLGGALTAYTDHRVLGPTDTMAAIAADLAGQQCPLKEFTKAHAAYAERRAEVEADPQAPDGAMSFITKSAARVALKAAAGVPVAGALTEAVDAEAFAQQMESLRVFISRKFRSQADVRLLLSPVEVLSPLFVAGIGECAGERGRPLALFFDTYERTGPLLDEWIVDLLEGRHGPLPADTVITLSGQHALDGNRWAPLRDIVCDLRLAPFSEAEARQLMAQRGVTDEHVADVILRLSGRLPLLVAMLAENQPADAAAVGDPSGSAVERFLRWEDDPRRRSVALAGAIPRSLNQDVLGVLVDDADGADGADEQDIGALYQWLRRMPFVTDSAGICQYHDVVRTAMIRLQRNQSPERWRRQHETLAHHFGRPAEGGSAGVRQDLTHDEAYHRLCASGPAFLSSALRQAARCWLDADEARAWARTLEQAGTDAGSTAVGEWGGRLQAALQETAEPLVAYYSRLLTYSGLDGPARAEALMARGACHNRENRHTAAITDYSDAHRYDPANPYVLANRGVARQQAGDAALARADFDAFIARRPDDPWAWVWRSRTALETSGTGRALADLERALTLAPAYRFALLERAHLHRTTGRYDLALQDFDRVLAGDPQDWFALTGRGLVHRLRGDFGSALEDLGAAQRIDPDNTDVPAQRALTYLALGDVPSAHDCLRIARAREPESGFALYVSALAHHQEGDLAGAVACMDAAITASPHYLWAYVVRAMLRFAEGEAAGALRDLDTAVALAKSAEDKYVSLGYRFLLRYLRRDYRPALDDLFAACDTLNADEAQFLFRLLLDADSRRPATRLVARMTASRIDPVNGGWREATKRLVRLFVRYWGLDSDTPTARQLRRRGEVGAAEFVSAEVEATIRKHLGSGLHDFPFMRLVSSVLASPSALAPSGAEPPPAELRGPLAR
ncbi:tetratricopeptide repeat protein [Streptomyces sp. NPDC051985]|uniref:tetratricopeptide repeat protein n=1 Tax=Streptomyces sp. NPDC051985 TaxID=3155807 RepID=UPI0034388AC5